LVQLDVYASEQARRSEEFKKLKVIRSDIACEGLWMVTMNPDLTTYEQFQPIAKRIPIILPKRGSGSAATFAILQEHDPKGLGEVREVNIRYMPDATAVINETASRTDGAVGFIVQFAEPENANIRLIAEKGLNVISMASRDILKITQPGGQQVYQQKEFTLKSGGLFDIFGFFAKRAMTACTPVAMITGAPEAIIGEEGKRDDQRALIQRIAELPPEVLVPQKSRMVEIIVYCRALVVQLIDEAGAFAVRMRRMIESLCCSTR
jgi:hypothetical protein